MNTQTTRIRAARVSDTRSASFEARIQAAREDIVEWARSYAFTQNADAWRELCRAKATLDALVRVAR